MYNDEDRARDQQTAAQAAANARDIAWLKDRIGGSLANPNGSVSDMLAWLKVRIGGSAKGGPSIAEILRNLRDNGQTPSEKGSRDDLD